MNYSEKEILEFEISTMKGKTPTKEDLPNYVEYGKGKRSCQIFFKNCAYCNILFTAKRKSQKHCSYKCSTRYRYKINKDNINEKRRSEGYDKKCSECGVEFHTQIKRVKACSDQCKKISQLKIKECLQCNTRYKLGDGRYCSSVCKERFSGKPVKHCRTCSKELPNLRYTFCSERCKKPKIEIVVKECESCGSEFNTKRKDQRFCSNKCNKKYYRDEHKKNNPEKWRESKRERNRLRKR